MIGSPESGLQHAQSEPPAMKASCWAEALKRQDSGCRRTLSQTYGPQESSWKPRICLLSRVLERFIERYGDAPVRIFRSPGRINLRGMHVDTHGGFLNLMTHQREMILAASPSLDDTCCFANIDQKFDDARFRIGALTQHLSFSSPWMEFITHPEVSGPVHAAQGRWDNYLKGAVLRAAREIPGAPVRGLRGVVGSDLPRGAALSSSHALCVVTLLGMLGYNGRVLSRDALILAVRDAEWFTGARTGTSDQSAEILGGRNELVNVALLAEDFDSSHARRLVLPDCLEVLVINSLTRRNLSGPQLAAYTRNRFAYSMAMDIVRQELRGMGWGNETAAEMDRLSRLTPENLGGLTTLYSLLEGIPEELPLEEMRRRYDLPDFDVAYERYFGNVPEPERPSSIGLRGPLTFGIAESERARRFLPALEEGKYAEAGRLMSVGHDGDRLLDASRRSFERRVTGSMLRRLAASQTPIAWVGGDYGASSPVLDGIVDMALSAGALGASLTGAGLAGAVLALGYREDTPRIEKALTDWMGGAEYAARAGRKECLSSENLEDAVLVNHAPMGAGELTLDGPGG